MRQLILLFLCCTGVQARAADYDQERIPLLSVITEMPNTALVTLKYSFSKESIPVWASIVTSTAVLYHYDDDIFLGIQADGRRWGVGNMDNTKTVISGFGYDLLRLPSDTGSALYFLGDGWTHITAALIFFGDGYITGHNRPYNTGLQIIHGMGLSTLFNQVLKRATGREDPSQATEPRGRWRPFPSVPSYQAHTSTYDAFPSGHIMTATLAFTVIGENYPEYWGYIFPVEIVWLSALAWEMVNNGVHWASDYPLGIGMGYAVGKMAARMGVKERHVAGNGPEKPSWSFFPAVGAFGPTMQAMYNF